MGTKLQPGQFDCYANAKFDEPMFVLLARGEQSPLLTELWAAVKAGNSQAFHNTMVELHRICSKNRRTLEGNPLKISEAQHCAAAMRAWKLANPEV